jgi:threonylcarbamoyladenosine tRNA methylthiotransferase MtaB
MAQDKLSFIIRTLGCKVNQYESQLMREQLVAAGFIQRQPDQDPDICVVNTCTVTEQSDAKSRQMLRGFIRKYPNSRIVAIGCYAESDAETLRNIDGVDLVLDNRKKETFTEEISSLLSVEAPAPAPLTITTFEGHTRAFVKIQDGCNNFCSYCKIPYVRGRCRSRDIDEVVSEVKSLSKNNFREIVLTGIHLGAFGKSGGRSENKLPQLIGELDKIEQLRRIRLSSIDPDEVTEDLIDAIACCSKVCHHLHISVQSGSDRILSMMNRRYIRQTYIQLAEKLYNKIPDISISTDIMAGFPGESESDFVDSLDLIEKVCFSKVHIFGFSPRKGTPAALMSGQVDPPTIKARIKRLKGAESEAAVRHRQKFIGTTQEILIEKIDDAHFVAEGFTNNYLRCKTSYTKDSGFPHQEAVFRSKIEKTEGTMLYGNTI